MITNYYETILKNIEIGDIAVYYLPSKYEEPTYWLVTQVDMEDKTIYGKQVRRYEDSLMFSYVPEDEAWQPRWISIADLDLRETVILNKYEFEEEEDEPLLDVVLEEIDLADIVSYDGIYWKVSKIDFVKEKVYCKQVIKEEEDGHIYYRDAHTDEELMPRWINVSDLDLVEINTDDDCDITDLELEEPVGNIMEIYKPGYEEPEEELEEEVCNEFDAMIYHVEYNLDYARGKSLKDIQPNEIIKFEGSIVSKGKVWVFQTTMGCVIIPFDSIIHMHPQY